MVPEVLGTAVSDSVVGSTASEYVRALAGDDTLDGGAGADTLLGGVGNDSYLVDSFDTAIELANEGVDTVLSSAGWMLGDNFENLTLTGAGAVNATGNAAGNLIKGNAAANTLDGGAGNDTLIGGAGNDTYFVDAAGDVVTEELDGGTDLVQSSINYVLGANLENLTLTGTIAINGTGNALANFLTGNEGPNVLNGDTGNDTMAGGAGNDTYVVDATGDVVTESANAGTDLVQSSITYVLGANLENLTLTGTAAINGSGNTLANILTGNAGANVLNGGASNDTMAGGAGNDTYVVDAAGDVVTEAASAGTDLVQSTISYVLGANLENLTLTGTSAINATGNTVANVLTGNAAANTLNGGAGNDTMAGGAGNDTYVVDATGDVVTEAANAGTDLVQAGVSYTLSANVENITLTGTAAINGTGNTLANVLTGNAAANTLNGGAGNDTMIGGAGNDTYVVDAIGDVVTEAANAGTDLVQSSVSYTLAANVENLTLTGTAAINGTGNALANVLTGNAAANVLDGGVGADTLIGGAGDDTYIVDDAGDVMTEGASGGIDLVRASVTYTLAANVENLTLTGSAAVNATGNSLANSLTGNEAANLLDGMTGADTMTGGQGDDTYYVDDLLDVVVEQVAGGMDSVQSTASHTLTAFVENLTLVGALAIDGTGNSMRNQITGNSANNVLIGGYGNDSIVGGAGDDQMDAAVVGVDLVLSLTGPASGTLIFGNGVWQDVAFPAGVLPSAPEGQAVAILGGAFAQTYQVVQGSHVDATQMQRSGDRVYLSGRLSDYRQTIEQDTLVYQFERIAGLAPGQSESLRFTLSDADSTLIFADGSIVMNALTDSHLYDVATEKASIIQPEWLTPGPYPIPAPQLAFISQGADTLAGGLGNDTYYVDDAGDTVVELAGEGTDTVQAQVTHTLAAHVENLTLVGPLAINATGNGEANVLTGNDAANRIIGGYGNDTLIGGLGDDVLDGPSTPIKAFQIGTAVRYYDASAVLGERPNASTPVEIGAAWAGQNLTVVGGSAVERIYVGAASHVDAVSLGGGMDEIYLTGKLQDYRLETAGTTLRLTRIGGLSVGQSETVVVAAGSGASSDRLVFTDGAIGTLALRLASSAGTPVTLDTTLLSNPLDLRFQAQSQGADVLIGGLGDDTYYVDDVGDVVTELSNEGVDGVRSSVTYTLSANLEQLTLTGTAAINGTGNGEANVLTGNEAANVLDGGAGNDTMAGGAGNDTYVIDAIGDVVTEAANAGTDLVQSSVTYLLAANLENLTLTGTAAINGTGNTLANILTGNAGANTLNGGAGNDTMIGGAGNDTYVVDTAGDVVTEAASAGTDLVQSSISYVLGPNLENLTLTGTAAINGTGNTVSNVLTGNAAANTLNGGAGNDTMAGGVGNDTYVVDATGDIVTEAANAGTDLVQSSVTYALSANVENLTLTGTAAINGTGNTLANSMIGNAAANILDGGTGNDTLTGGAGNDTYKAYRGMGKDRIVENDSKAGNADVLSFGPGIDLAQLWLRQVGNDLEVSVIGTTDSATVQNWYLGSQYRVEQIKTSDGKALIDSRVQGLVQAMAAFAPPPVGQTTLSSSVQATLAPILASSWQ